MKISFFLLLFSTITILISAEAAHSEYTTTQITNAVDSYSVSLGDINDNGQIVWSEWIEGSSDNIYLYNGTRIIQITDDSYIHEEPQINDSGHAVWIGFRALGLPWFSAPPYEYKIFLYNGKSVIELADNPDSISNPQISNNGHVVWVQNGEILLYDGKIVHQITNDSRTPLYPQVNDNGHVVWQALASNFQVFLYDGQSNLQLPTSAQNGYYPQINNNGHVVWHGSGGYNTDWEIYLYNGATTTQLTDNSYDDENPQINQNGYVVWEGVGDIDSDWEIFLYDGTSTIRLTDNAYDDQNPQVNDNGHVVWHGYDGSDDEIFLYNGTTTIQLTNNAYDDRNPQINNNGYVVWVGNGRIFLAKPDTRADVEAFVTRFYQQCLGREPEKEGLDGWVNALVSGSICGATVANGFIFSQEFINQNTTNEDFVTVLYRAFFGRDPDAPGYNGWVNFLYSGASRQDVFNGFVYSQEFENLCGRYGIEAYSEAISANGGVEGFVSRFYHQCLSRAPDENGLDGWVNALGNGSISGADVANGFIFSEEFINRNTSNEDFLTILYRAFFNREPDSGGYSSWVDYLYSGATRQEVLNGFIYSQEFENLCNSYGIAPYIS